MGQHPFIMHIQGTLMLPRNLPYSSVHDLTRPNQQLADATYDGRAYVISFCIPNLQCLAVNRLKPIQLASPCLQDTSGIGRYVNGRTDLVKETRLLKHLLKLLANDSQERIAGYLAQ